MKNLTFFDWGGEGPPGAKGPLEGWGMHRLQKFGKASYRTVVSTPNPHQKFMNPSWIGKCLKNELTKMWGERKEDILDPILVILCHKNLNNRNFDTRIFAIRSRVPTKAIKVFKTTIVRCSELGKRGGERCHRRWINKRCHTSRNGTVSKNTPQLWHK